MGENVFEMDSIFSFLKMGGFYLYSVSHIYFSVIDRFSVLMQKTPLMSFSKYF